MKFILLFIVSTFSAYAETAGTVGNIQFEKISDSAIAIHWHGGGAEELLPLSHKSTFLKCKQYVTNYSPNAARSEDRLETSCVMKLDANGFIALDQEEPIEDHKPIEVGNILNGEDHRFDYWFAAGNMENTDDKLVWIRGSSAKELLRRLSELGSRTAQFDQVLGQTLSCFYYPSRRNTRSGMALMARVVPLCKFVMKPTGEIRAYDIPQWILDWMKRNPHTPEKATLR